MKPTPGNAPINAKDRLGSYRPNHGDIRPRRRHRRLVGSLADLAQLRILQQPFLHEPLLSLVHAPKDHAAMNLRGGEGDMQQRSHHLEGNLPAVPETAEQEHGHDGLAGGSDGGGEA